MSTMTATTLTIAEMQNRLGPNGEMKQIIETMKHMQPMLNDLVWQEANMGTYHEVTYTAGSETAGQFRAYDQGITPTTVVSDTRLEPTCMMDELSKVDSEKLMHHGGLAMRLQADTEIMTKMGRQFALKMISASRTTNPLEPLGIYSRSDYTDLSSDQVYDNAKGDASATANKSSILMVNWGYKRCSMIYPRGGAPGKGLFGIRVEDKGEHLVKDSASKEYMAWVTWMALHWGFCVESADSIFRLANVVADPDDDEVEAGTSFAFDEKVLIKMYTMAKTRYPSGWTMYVPPLVGAQIWQRASDRGGNFITATDPFGQPITRFLDVNIRITDALTMTEAQVA